MMNLLQKSQEIRDSG